MYTHYLYWHYVRAPRWLARLGWNLERVLLRYFSVGVMLKTLFSHWRKDQVSYKQGSFSGIVKAFSFNMISRGIGFIVRSMVLLLWVIVQTVYLAVAAVAFLLFLAWPVFTVLAFLAGLSWLGA